MYTNFFLKSLLIGIVKKKVKVKIKEFLTFLSNYN